MLTADHLKNSPSLPGLNSSNSAPGSNRNEPNDGITPATSGGDRRFLEGQQLSPPEALIRTTKHLLVKDAVLPIPGSTGKKQSTRKTRRRKKSRVNEENDFPSLNDCQTPFAHSLLPNSPTSKAPPVNDSEKIRRSIEKPITSEETQKKRGSTVVEKSNWSKKEKYETFAITTQPTQHLGSMQIHSSTARHDKPSVSTRQTEDATLLQRNIPPATAVAALPHTSSSSSFEAASTSSPDAKNLSSGSSSDQTQASQKMSRENSNRSMTGYSSSHRHLFENSPASSTRSSLLGQNFLPEFEELSLAYSSHGSSAGSSGPLEISAPPESKGSNHSDRSNESRSLLDLVVAPRASNNATGSSVYDGPLVALVEALHGSGSSMDFNESLNSFTTNPSDLSKPHQTSSCASVSFSVSTKQSQGRDNYKSSSEFCTSSEMQTSVEMYLSSSSSSATSAKEPREAAPGFDSVGKGKRSRTMQQRRASAPKSNTYADQVLSPSKRQQGHQKHHNSSSSFGNISFGSAPASSAGDAEGDHKVSHILHTNPERRRSSRRHSWAPSTMPKSRVSSLSSHLKLEPRVSDSRNATTTCSSAASLEGTESVKRKLDGIGESRGSHNSPMNSSPVARRQLCSDRERRRTNSLPARLDRIRSHRRRDYIMSKLPKDQSPRTPTGERITISKLVDHLAVESLGDPDKDVSQSPDTPPSSGRRKNRTIGSTKSVNPINNVDARARTLRTSNRSCDMLPPRVQNRSSRPPSLPSSPWDKARAAIGHLPLITSSVSSVSTSESSSSRWSFSSFSISSGSSHGPKRSRAETHAAQKTPKSGAITYSLHPPPILISPRHESRHSICTSDSETKDLDPLRSITSDDGNGVTHSSRRRSLDEISSHSDYLSSAQRRSDDSFSDDSWSPDVLSQATSGAMVEHPIGETGESRKVSRNKSGSSSSCSLDLAPFRMEIPSSPKEVRRRRHHKQTSTESAGSASISEGSEFSEDSFARHQRRSLAEDEKSVPSLAASSYSSGPSQVVISSLAPPLPTIIGDSHGSFDSPIWSKLKSEKERQGKIRARLLSISGTSPISPECTSPHAVVVSSATVLSKSPNP